MISTNYIVSKLDWVGYVETLYIYFFVSVTIMADISVSVCEVLTKFWLESKVKKNVCKTYTTRVKNPSIAYSITYINLEAISHYTLACKLTI